MTAKAPLRLAAKLLAGIGTALLLWVPGAWASPWAEPGDSRLRSDIELLADAGLIDGITTQWPLPWAGILTSLGQDGALDGRPQYLRDAASYVGGLGHAQTRTGELRTTLTLDATNDPGLVRGFDAMGREYAQSQISMELMGATTAVRLNIGVQTPDHRATPAPPAGVTVTFDPNSGYGTPYYLSNHPDHQTLVLDGSYIAQRIGGAVVYAGYLPHWWGPGWISAMMMSTNARPMPQVGIARLSTSAFTWPVLRWLGPWQAEIFYGVLDGPRLTSNTLYDGLRFTFNPLPGLELSAARSQFFCGTQHPCKPLVDFVQVQHSVTNPDQASSQGQFDARYGRTIGGIPVSIYMQSMFMDAGRLTPMSLSNLGGVSAWVPVSGRTMRVTLEYASSVPTYNFLTFGDVEHGFSYNLYKYPEGMRYRGRTLGFSLDSDSTLLSLQASWTNSRDWTYTFTLHHAAVSNPNNTPALASPGAYGNVVTTAPVHINLAEARVTIPLRRFDFDFALRVQDDQPRPDHGFTAGAELALRMEL